MKFWSRLAVTVVLMVTASGVAWGAEESNVLRLRAEQLITQGRYEEAIERAQRARKLDPSDAYAARAEGSAQLGLGRYREALSALQAASDLDPNLSQVWTLQAQAHYHLDEFEQARVALDRAEAADPNDGRMHLYRGLLLSRDARDEEAAQAFDRASELDPTLTDAAGLFAGRSWARADRDKATRALDRARRADPDSEYGLEAARQLDQLGDPFDTGEWLRIRVGAEYDDNVALRVSGVANPIAVQFFGPFRFGERSDFRAVWEAQAGFELSTGPSHALGIIAGYQGNHHDEFDEFNLQFPWLSIFWDLEIADDTWVRFQP
ncbi:MAG: tetratricopeptide repeat protein, partial [Myxococcota bacterium]